MSASGFGAGTRVLLFAEQPGTQLGVIATGLTAVVGSTAWQVMWLIGVAVRVLVAAFGPPGSTRDDSDSGGGNGGGGGGGLGSGPGPRRVPPAGTRGS